MENDRVTEVPEDRNAYENAACAATAPKTIPPEAVDATDPWDAQNEAFFEGDDTVLD